MKFNSHYLTNQKGITLVELLATLAILTIFGGLIYSIITSSFLQNEKVESHIAVRQEANIVITKLRQLHKENAYTLCYEDDQKIYLDTNKGNSLSSMAFTFADVDINNIGASTEAGDANPITAINECNTKVDPSYPLSVKFTLVDQDGNQFRIDTIINRLGKY